MGENIYKWYDLQKVNMQAMSRKSFIKKWANATDDVADEELKQIVAEARMLEAAFNTMLGDNQQQEDDIDE